MEKVWHTVKFKYGSSHSSLPEKWQDCDSDEMSEPTQWCIDNVGLKNYAFRRLVGPGMIFYQFSQKMDASLFRLTWGDF